MLNKERKEGCPHLIRARKERIYFFFKRNLKNCYWARLKVTDRHNRVGGRPVWAPSMDPLTVLLRRQLPVFGQTSLVDY